MNRANQQALFQQTNQAVLGIRQLEINYYTNLYGVFGTQAILMGGFVYGTFTQNNIDDTNPGEDIFQTLYFVFSALTIALSVHIMLSTMILQVYGPGLALNGPLGSMARATEGLQVEQNQVIVSFVYMLVAFSFSTVWIFWTVMTMKEACACTVVFVFAARQWYFYSERIYLRFYWNKNETNWNNGGVDDDMEFDQEPQVPGAADASNNPLHNEEASQSQYKEKKLRFPFALSMKKTPAESQSGAEASTPKSNEGTAISSDAKGVDLGASHTKGMVAMEGYFTTRGRSEQQVILESRRWERQYFVLFRTGEFYVYKTRQNFRADPKSPVYNRPVRLIDHFVKIANADQDMRSEYEDDGKTVSSVNTNKRDSTKPPPFRFQITLVPRENEEAAEGMGTGAGRPAQLRNQWLLRCDTEEELEIWLGSIRDVCPGCFVDA